MRNSEIGVLTNDGTNRSDALHVSRRTGDLTELRSEALELVNEARERHALPALQSRPELDRAAQAHAGEKRENICGIYWDPVALSNLARLHPPLIA